MTDQQINQRIAEACGWGWFQKIWTGETLGKPISEQGPLRSIPDYCTDLNAMHKAEKVLTYEQCAFFRTHLRERIENHAASLFVWHATARQRAEAFLRTLGKWEEVQG